MPQSDRVQRLLAQMSRDEKLAVIRGASEPADAFQGQAGWIRGVPRLGIPDLRFADGPPGVLVRHVSTGMPATLAMAATFSRAEAAANGAVIGRDARTLGIDVILQPYINLLRDPTFERAYNTLGEDPVLTGTLAAEFVKGAQAEGVMAQAKHFVAYDGAHNAIVDAQALREVYLAPFKAVVDAGVASIMCSYNRINGTYSCGNELTLDRILRDEYGFRGFVTSDWGAAHAPEFITRGMDMEQPGTGSGAMFSLGKEPAERGMTGAEVAELVAIMNFGVPEEQGYPRVETVEDDPPVAGASKNLGEALERGSVKDADIDRAVARVLGQMERFGWLDHAPSHAQKPEAIEENARVIQRTAERGAVLLKNDGVLPLKPADLESLALIGPGALQTFAIVAGQEQSYGRADRQIGVWHALETMTNSAGIKLAVANDMTGEPIPASAFANLKRSSGKGAARIDDTQIDFTRRSGKPLAAGTAATWSGTLIVPVAGEYEISLQLLGATGKFRIDGKAVGEMRWWGGHGEIVFPNRDNVIPTTDGLDNLRRRVHLSAGRHTIGVEVNPDVSGDAVQVRLAWVTPQMKQRTFAAAIEAARTSKVAVVFAWSRNRPWFGLPGDQDRLISEVAAVNPNTIVVLNTGQAVAMPWVDRVRAVLEMWYTGDEGGWAAANLLSGRTSPAGRLPFTWPRRLEDGPATNPAHPEAASTGSGGGTRYTEGIHIGYRWFDREHIEPLFPFGHGLSYTRFTYSEPSVKRAADGGLDVACIVRNSGEREADEVVQVYLDAPDTPPTGAAFAVRALADFTRITLQPGESQRVALHVSPERLRYWSLKDSAWHALSGPRTIRVGASSRDLRLSVRFPGDARDESTARPHVSVVPRPVSLEQRDGTFELDDQTRIVAPDAESRRIADLLNDYLFSQHGVRLTITAKPLKGHTSIVLTNARGGDSSDEGYHLTVSPEAIRLTGKPAGLFYGMQTLTQLLPLGPSPVLEVPIVDITDRPRFEYRGVLLDVGRHFFSVPTIKKTLDLAAQYKINRFHWHLTDNEGWRIEIKKYPQLTAGSSEYYTQEQIRDIVAYARARFITIVPEIEMPGHAGAATAAYPNLTCSEGEYANVLCPREETFTFVQDVLNEAMTLFPGPYIHIGGDEVDKEGWRRSPEAQAIMKREGLKNEEELQAYFIRHVAQFLTRKGRKPIGWDEILEGGLAPDAIVMSWRGESGGIEAARQQHAVIMSPSEYCYFDYNQGDPLREPESIGGFIPLAKAYSYDPVPKEMSPEHRHYVLGAQANLWTEYVATPEHLQYMLFPRLLAFAEAAWSPTEGKSYDDFRARLVYQLGRLDRQDVRYRIPEPAGLADVYTATADRARVDLTSLVAGSRIFYTLDGSMPTENASRYESPFEIPLQPERPTRLNLIVVARDGRRSVPYSATYLRSAYREAIRADGLQPGLAFTLHEGEFSTVRDIQRGKAAANGTTVSFDPGQFGPQFDFGVAFEGYLKVPADGYYRFEMESDDGGFLKIGDDVVIDNDGNHAPRILIGHVPLRQGLHRFNLRYFQARGGSVLRLGWANGDDELQPLTGSALYH